MAFNTGNPLGSTDPRDLSDNSEVFDKLINDLTSFTTLDRFGNPRVTLAGQIGYIGTGVDGAIESYAPGLELTTFSTIIEYNGEFYRPSASATLPYTTTATTPDVDSNLVAVGDAVLRQDLANNAAAFGSDLVAFQGTTQTVTQGILDRTQYVADITSMIALPSPLDGAHYGVTGYHPNSDTGGGVFYWDASRDKADHDGGTVIDPGKTFPADWSISGDVTTWFTADGVGTGCYVRDNVAELMPQMYGAGPSVIDSSASIQKTIDVAKNSYSNALGKFVFDIDFGGKSFACASSIDATGVRQPRLTISNGGIYSTANAKIALDFAGTNEPVLSDFKVFGDETSPPAVGIYIGRADISGGFPASPSATFKNVVTNGYFNKAGVINFASEVSDYSGCFFINRSRSLTAYSYINCNNAQTLVDFVGALTSDFITLPVPADGSFSNILHNDGQARYLRNADVVLTVNNITNANPAVVTVDSTALADSGLANGDELYFYNIVGMTELNYRTFTIANINVGAGTFELSGEDSSGYGAFVSGQVFNRTGSAVLFGGSHKTKWDEAYILSYGTAPIRFDLDNGTEIRDMDLSFQAEHSPSTIIEMYNSTGTKTVRKMNLRLLQSNQVISNDVIRRNGTSDIQIDGLNLSIANMGTAPANGLFQPAPNFILSGANIYTPLESSLNLGNLQSFTGQFYAADTDLLLVRGSGNTYKLFNDSAGANRNFVINDQATTSQLEDIAHRVNNEDKYAGKMVWNVTTTKPVFATNAMAGGTWRDATGAIVHTPV